MEYFGEGDADGFVGWVCIHDICHICPPALHYGLGGECVHGFGVGGFEHAEEGQCFFIKEDGVVGDAGFFKESGKVGP